MELSDLDDPEKVKQILQVFVWPLANWNLQLQWMRFELAKSMHVIEWKTWLWMISA